MVTGTASMDKKHLEAMLANKERVLADLQQEMSERDTRYQTSVARLEARKAELEVDVQQEAEARKELITKTRDMNFRTEQEVNTMREDLQKAQQGERRALADH